MIDRTISPRHDRRRWNGLTQAGVAAGVVDEFWLSVVPVFLGSGERPFDDMPSGVEITLEDVVAAPDVAHHKYALR